MDDFLTFDDGLFESNERTKGLLPVFHPNEVGNLVGYHNTPRNYLSFRRNFYQVVEWSV